MFVCGFATELHACRELCMHLLSLGVCMRAHTPHMYKCTTSQHPPKLSRHTLQLATTGEQVCTAHGQEDLPAGSQHAPALHSPRTHTLKWGDLHCAGGEGRLTYLGRGVWQQLCGCVWLRHAVVRGCVLCVLCVVQGRACGLRVGVCRMCACE